MYTRFRVRVTVHTTGALRSVAAGKNERVNRSNPDATDTSNEKEKQPHQESRPPQGASALQNSSGMQYSAWRSRPVLSDAMRRYHGGERLAEAAVVRQVDCTNAVQLGDSTGCIGPSEEQRLLVLHTAALCQLV